MITIENPNFPSNEIMVPDPSLYELTANHPDDISSMSDIPNLSFKLNVIQDQKEPFNKNEAQQMLNSMDTFAMNNNSNSTLKKLNPSPTRDKRKSKLTETFNQTIGGHLSKRLMQNSSHGEGRRGEEEEEGGDGGEKKEELVETFKKKKEMIENNNESEKNSVSSTTLISSKKFLKNTILLEYVPKSFDYLKYCLMASILFIYLSQILNVVFITQAYNDLQENFNHDFQYDEITPYLFRILRSSYKLCLVDSETEKSNLMNLVRT